MLRRGCEIVEISPPRTFPLRQFDISSNIFHVMNLIYRVNIFSAAYKILLLSTIITVTAADYVRNRNPSNYDWQKPIEIKKKGNINSRYLRIVKILFRTNIGL